MTTRSESALSTALSEKQSEFDAYNARSIYSALQLAMAPRANFSDPEDVKQRIAQYFTFCAETGMKCSVSGIAASLGITQRMLSDARSGRRMNGEKGKVPPETLEMIDEAYTIYQMVMEDLMLSGKADKIGAIFLLKCNSGYNENPKDTISTSDPLGDLGDVSDIASKYANLPD